MGESKMSEDVFTLEELLDLSIGTPQGTVNFTALHALLHAVLRQLGIRGLKTRWRDSPSGRTAGAVPGTAEGGPLQVEGDVEQLQERAASDPGSSPGTELQERAASPTRAPHPAPSSRSGPPPTRAPHPAHRAPGAGRLRPGILTRHRVSRSRPPPDLGSSPGTECPGGGRLQTWAPHPAPEHPGAGTASASDPGSSPGTELQEGAASDLGSSPGTELQERAASDLGSSPGTELQERAASASDPDSSPGAAAAEDEKLRSRIQSCEAGVSEVRNLTLHPVNVLTVNI